MIITYVALFVMVIVIAATLFQVFNRKTLRLVENAKSELNKRVAALAPCDIDKFFDQCGFNNDERQSAHLLLITLAEMLRVTPEQLACDIPLVEILVVSHKDATMEGGVSHIDAYTSDLIERISAISDKKQWKKKWEREVDLPRDEDGLARLILNMTISEFLKFFAPLVNKRDGNKIIGDRLS